MAKASDNVFPYIHLAPGVAPAAPAAGLQRLYIDSADGNKLKRKDSAGTVSTIEGGGGGGGSGSGSVSTRVRMTTTSMVFTHNVEAAVPWDTEDFDLLSAHDNTTNPSRLIAPTTGKYRIETRVLLASTKIVFINIRKNGTTSYISKTYFTSNQMPNDGQCGGVSSSGIFDLAAGDYVEVLALHFKAGGSGTTTLDTDTTAWAWASFEKVA